MGMRSRKGRIGLIVFVVMKNGGRQMEKVFLLR